MQPGQAAVENQHPYLESERPKKTKKSQPWPRHLELLRQHFLASSVSRGWRSRRILPRRPIEDVDPFTARPAPYVFTPLLESMRANLEANRQD